MACIEATTHVEAPPAQVWALLTAWETQAQWMVDALRVEVRSGERRGAGVVLRCRTRIVGGFAVDDEMAVTEWVEERVLGVRHLGRLIRGVGAFELEPTPVGTRLTWWEEVDPPLGALGELGAQLLVAPLIRRVFRASLARFKALCESQSVRP